MYFFLVDKSLAVSQYVLSDLLALCHHQVSKSDSYIQEHKLHTVNNM